MSKIIIFQKCENDILSDYIEQRIREKENNNSDVKVYKITEKTVKPCTGCLNCWYKTPGVCATKDLARELNRCFVNEDLVVIITKLSFGGYSSTMKSVIDRGIAIMLPFLKNTENENHHVRRFHQWAKQIVCAYGEDIKLEEQEMFSKIIKANSLNYDIEKADLYFGTSKKEIDNMMQDLEF